MRIYGHLKALTGNVKSLFLKYSKFNPTPLSLKELNGFMQNGEMKKSVEFLRLELAVRLANMMQEIQLLPDKLLNSSSGKLVIEIYDKNFKDIIQFEKKNASDVKVQEEFTKVLADISQRNYTNVDILSEGVMEMKEKYGIDSSTDSQMSYFLDRYYLSRISIRLLINQHVLLFAPELANKTAVGGIESDCDVVEVIKSAYDNAKFLCDHHYLDSPPLCIRICTGESALKFVYIPSHLYHMVFELLKNSMRAIMEMEPKNVNEKPITILVVNGKEDIIIKISDEGGGIKRSMIPLVFSYSFTSTQPVSPGDSGGNRGNGQAAMAGYGYGLPLSRLYARYLHGDLQLTSVDQLGTDALIFLKRDDAHADELLPIFSGSVKKQHESSSGHTDWSR